jgi:hypothetical protein
MPSLNPDGYARTLGTSPRGGFCGGTELGADHTPLFIPPFTNRATRRNAKFVDLNRNFPSPWENEQRDTQPETLAVMKWNQLTPFILDGNFHGGAVVVNYPYDGGIGRGRIPIVNRSINSYIFVRCKRKFVRCRQAVGSRRR